MATVVTGNRNSSSGSRASAHSASISQRVYDAHTEVCQPRTAALQIHIRLDRRSANSYSLLQKKIALRAKSNNNNGLILRYWVRPIGRCCSEAFRLSRRENVLQHSSIGSQYLFATIAFETLGPMITSACQLLAKL